MPTALERILEIDAQIEALTKARGYYIEQCSNEYSDDSKQCIDKIPAAVRTALRFARIETDNQLALFLAGEAGKSFTHSDLFSGAKNPKERLKTLRNVGEKLANDTLEILKKENFL